MQHIQLIQITPEQLQNAILEGVKILFEDLKKFYQPKESPKYVTRNYVAEEMLHCNISTIHNLTVKGILTKYQIGGRVLYIRQQVEEAIVRLKK